MSERRPKICIVGAGWAGLSAAITLAKYDIDLVVYEASPGAGGRAMSVISTDDLLNEMELNSELGKVSADAVAKAESQMEFAEIILDHDRLLDNYDSEAKIASAQLNVDELKEEVPVLRDRVSAYPSIRLNNGQHYFFPGYFYETLGLLNFLGVDVENSSIRTPFLLEFHAKDCVRVIEGIWLRGFKRGERFAVLRAILNLWRKDYPLAKNWLKDSKQSEELINDFWAPVILALTSTPLDVAGAATFKKVLSNLFFSSRKISGIRNNDLFFWREDFSSLFVDRALDYLAAKDVKIYYSTRVTEIKKNAKGGLLINGNDGFDGVLISIAMQNLLKLLPSLFPQIQPIFSSITTVYLRYDEKPVLPQIITGMTGGIVQWVYDLERVNGSQNLVAAIMLSFSSSVSRISLIDSVASEINRRFGGGKVVEGQVFISREATFASTPKRPKFNIRPQKNLPLWLAGDFMMENHPACLEVSVRTGIYAATQLSKALIPTEILEAAQR